MYIKHYANEKCEGITPCPNNVLSSGGLQIMVGSFSCLNCKFFENEHLGVVTCLYEKYEKQEEQEDEENMEVELPENIVDFTVLKIKYDRQKICQCPDPSYIVDMDNRLVTCSQCGAYTDPFDALVCLASKPEEFRRQLKALLAQSREIANYKPHMKVFRELEGHYRKSKFGRMIPRCPHCGDGFLFEDISGWVNETVAKKEREGVNK